MDELLIENRKCYIYGYEVLYTSLLIKRGKVQTISKLEEFNDNIRSIGAKGKLSYKVQYQGSRGKILNRENKYCRCKHMKIQNAGYFPGFNSPSFHLWEPPNGNRLEVITLKACFPGIQKIRDTPSGHLL